jgi:hypothetical protein
MKLTVVVGLALALAGCAPMQFTKAGVTDEEFRRDSYECRQQVLMIPGVATNPLIAPIWAASSSRSA